MTNMISVQNKIHVTSMGICVCITFTQSAPNDVLGYTIMSVVVVS